MLGALLLVPGLAGCARSVAVPPPTPSPTGSSARECAQLWAALPGTLEGQSRRATEPDGVTTTAAWGDPPIVLRCGVGRPEDMAPTSEAVEIDGVAWFPQELTAGYRFTTTGLGTRVEVTVPDAYAPETGPLVDLSPVIAASMPSVTRKAVPAS